MSVNFVWFGKPVRVIRRVPGKPAREWRTWMLADGSHGLIKAGTDVRAGDEIYEISLLGRPRLDTSRIVAYVDWASRSPEQLGVITWVGAAPSRQLRERDVDVDIEIEALRLVEWLARRPQGRYVPVSEFLASRGLPLGSDQLLRDYLLSRGWAKDASDMDAVDLMVSATGLAYVQAVQAERSNPAKRARALQRQMLQWLYEHNPNDPPNDWSGFLASGRFTMLGQEFTEGEVAAAAEYLTNRQLVAGSSVEEALPGTFYPRLTADGYDCVTDYEGNVSDYLSRHKVQGATNIHMSGIQGNTVIGNSNIVQNASGLDASKLLDFAKFVRQVAPTLDLEEEQQRNLKDQANQLVEAAAAPEPERGKLRRLGDSLMAGLAAAAPSVVSSTAIAMGEEALKAITA